MFSIASNIVDTLDYGSLVELARQLGFLVLEEQGYPEMIRTRLRRSQRL
jgi:hypothetical protein